MNNVIPSIEDENYKTKPDFKNQMPFYSNEFFVYENYEIILGDDDIWGNSEVIIKATTENYSIFNPNTYPQHLYIEIAKIIIDEEIGRLTNEKGEIEEILLHRIRSSESKKSLLKFSKRFGLLGVSERTYFFKRLNEDAFTKGHRNIVVTNFKKDLINQDMVTGIFRMKIAVNYLKKLAEENITEQEQLDLVNIVNDELPFKQDRLQVKDGKCYPATLFSSLIDLAWWQLREALLNGTEYKHCKNDRCGNIFAVTHGNQDYCPPNPNKDRSRCENAYNRRLKYKRRKLASKD
ncbi:hypothetical protein [Neobacillus drentensis]|uniref:hypothetical protein n=1 Tax=Neobacillus drentensis TaxID=220684 RepID=UPI002FFE145C